MFRGSVYLFAMIKYFSFSFFLFIPFATQLFSTPVRHQTYATKLRYLWSSACYRQPKKVFKSMKQNVFSGFCTHINIIIKYCRLFAIH